MHLFWLVLFGLIALFWMTYGLKVAYGALRLPWLKDYAPAVDADCPRISVLFAARDEEEKLPGALATLGAVDYPKLENGAVGDPSRGATRRDFDAVSNPNSRAYVGVGAFQMLKRGAYEACGTHRRLAMEVIDDMKLGKLVKQGGFRSGVAIAQDAVSVEWHLGLENLVRGLEKNFFAGAGFSVGAVALHIVSLLFVIVAPVLGLAFVCGLVL